MLLQLWPSSRAVQADLSGPHSRRATEAQQNQLRPPQQNTSLQLIGTLESARRQANYNLQKKFLKIFTEYGSGNRRPVKKSRASLEVQKPEEIEG